MKRKRILFFAEAVTLAHVGRPWLLAEFVADRYEVHFACAEAAARGVIGGDSDSGVIVHWGLPTLSPESFNSALREARMPYDLETLKAYVAAERRLLNDIKPDVVVGDFRFTLQVSARQMDIPYVNLMNAHWNPLSPLPNVIPEHPLLDRFGGLGSRIGRVLGPLVLPLSLQRAAAPVNQLRAEAGFSKLRTLRDAYADADYIFHPDPRALIHFEMPANRQAVLGPIVWSPDVPLPSWWNELNADGPKTPIVYVTLGSSGAVECLPVILKALESESIRVLLATARRAFSPEVAELIEGMKRRELIFTADYLPGTEAAKRSLFTICNGGSGTAYQSLMAGTPTIGIAGNLDQHLTMKAIETEMAGIYLRSSDLHFDSMRRAIQEIVNNVAYQRNAQRLMVESASLVACKEFARLIEAVVNGKNLNAPTVAIPLYH